MRKHSSHPPSPWLTACFFYYSRCGGNILDLVLNSVPNMACSVNDFKNSVDKYFSDCGRIEGVLCKFGFRINL